MIWASVKEAATRCGVSTQYIYKLIKGEKIVTRGHGSPSRLQVDLINLSNYLGSVPEMPQSLGNFHAEMLRELHRFKIWYAEQSCNNPKEWPNSLQRGEFLEMFVEWVSA